MNSLLRMAALGGVMLPALALSFPSVSSDSFPARDIAAATRPSPPKIVQVDGGKFSSFALYSNGNAYGWGGNGGDLETGQLCNGTTEDTPYPMQVLLTGIHTLGIGRYHTLAATEGGAVYSCGYNKMGQLGNGDATLDPNATPEQIPGLVQVAQIDGGWVHSLALHASQKVITWGSNEVGQLGNGSPGGPDQLSTTPVWLTSLAGITAISAGVNHNLAIQSNSIVWTWGNNEYGQLGNGTLGVGQYSSLPVQVQGIYTAIDVAGGADHSLALLGDGTVLAWGSNTYGQLGDGTSLQRSTPVRVTNLDDVVEIAAGHWFSLALKADGTVWAWGRNYYGQLGDGSVLDSATPVQVKNLRGITSIGAGREHGLAVAHGRTVFAWGHNAYGQLGDGTDTSSSVPVRVQGLP